VKNVAVAVISWKGVVVMESIWMSERVIVHTDLLVRSYRRFTGRDLLPEVERGLDLARRVYESPVVVVSHGIEADPVLNYGNATALGLWEMSWDELTRTPSRLTAEAPERDERARLLAEVAAHGFIDNYSGIRISKMGRRFRIEQATVWNLVNESGEAQGQAATFRQWTWVS
jgi:hypothetical protein